MGHLAKMGKISQIDLVNFEELRKLRNKYAHESTIVVDEQVEHFLNIALDLSEKLRHVSN